MLLLLGTLVAMPSVHLVPRVSLVREGLLLTPGLLGGLRVSLRGLSISIIVVSSIVVMQSQDGPPEYGETLPGRAKSRERSRCNWPGEFGAWKGAFLPSS